MGGSSLPKTVLEGRNELLYRAGIIKDDLYNLVLCFGVRGYVLGGAASSGNGRICEEKRAADSDSAEFKPFKIGCAGRAAGLRCRKSRRFLQTGFRGSPLELIINDLKYISKFSG